MGQHLTIRPTTTTVIVWLSRHLPTPRQQAELHRLFPTMTLRVDTRSFSTADDIIQRFHTLGGSEMVVVAPLSVIRALVDRGIQPLYAQMAQCSPTDPRREVSSKGRHLRFVNFKRITSITIEMEDVA